MAFVYEYHLRNKIEREQYTLANYADKFISVLSDTFEENLKDVIIKEDSLIFKLYKSAFKKELRTLGRKIKKQVINTKYGLVRKEVEVFAVAEEINENIISFHLVDASIEHSDSFENDVNSYCVKNNITRYSQTIKNNYYVDVYEGDAKYACFSDDKNELKVGDVLKLRAVHKKIENSDDIVKIESNDGKGTIFLKDFYDYKYLIQNDSNSNNEDCFCIKKAEKISKEKFNDIKSVLDKNWDSAFDITFQPELLISKGDKNQIVEFCVHNVGQALATSFAYENSIPFLYFDYGMPYGRNSQTLVAPIALNVEKQTKIILSHIHKDHWNGLNWNVDAFKCTWYVPLQKSLIFCRRMAEIIIAGGNVNFICHSIKSGVFEVSCAEPSINDPGRVANKIHETGLALCVDAKDINRKKYKILIEGDQDYDYLLKDFLLDVNCLVACHHGGEYSWSNKTQLPNLDKNNNIIVYSCGLGNSYGHPSKRNDYFSVGWKNEFITYAKGKFEKKIYLK